MSKQHAGVLLFKFEWFYVESASAISFCRLSESISGAVKPSAIRDNNGGTIPNPSDAASRLANDGEPTAT